MDTRATKSCMNYNTAYKDHIKTFNTMQVVGVDGSDLGAIATLQCKNTIGDVEVDQTYIVCQHLRRNVILGTDFAKANQAGVSWMRQGTRVLSIKGIARLEVEEDKLGIPVTTKYHVKVPSRYSAVFEVNLHGNCEGTKIISPNKQLMEMNQNAFQHEISIKTGWQQVLSHGRNHQSRPRENVTSGKRRDSGLCPQRRGGNELY